MKHIVFVLGTYTPEASPITNCVKNVIDCMMLDKRWTITCVCGSVTDERIDKVDGITVHRVYHQSYSDKVSNCRDKYKLKLYKYMHFLHSVMVFPFFPNTELTYTDKLYKTLLNVHEQQEIDCIVGVFRPYASIAAMMKFKKKFNDTKCICYFLDILRGSNIPFGIGKKHYERLCINRERKLFQKADKVILPECGEVYYRSQQFDVYRSKIVYLNFPTLLIHEEKNKARNTEKTRIVFAGTTDKQYRDPRYAINALLGIQDKTIEIHVYGRSDLVEELEKIQRENPKKFYFHGLVSKDEADKAIDNADYVISLGNNIDGVVPSKTFELMGKKKSLLHFSVIQNDSSLFYINQYPDKLVIDTKFNVAYATDLIKEYLNHPKVLVDNIFLNQTFFTATPQAVSEAIVELLGDMS